MAPSKSQPDDSNGKVEEIITSWISVYSKDKHFSLIQQAVVQKMKEKMGNERISNSQNEQNLLNDKPVSLNLPKEELSKEELCKNLDKNELVKKIRSTGEEVDTSDFLRVESVSTYRDLKFLNMIADKANSISPVNDFKLEKIIICGQEETLSSEHNKGFIHLLPGRKCYLYLPVRREASWPISVILEIPLYLTLQNIKFNWKNDQNEEIGFAIGQITKNSTIQIDVFFSNDENGDPVEIPEASISYPFSLTSEILTTIL